MPLPPASHARNESTASGTRFFGRNEDNQQKTAPNRSEAGRNVRVAIRCRPVHPTEKARGDRECCRFVQNQEVQILSAYSQQTEKETIRSFCFDHCASPGTNQTEFFESCGVVSILDAVVQGYLGTVFAYGQTGSGKTYSMSGLEELITTDTQAQDILDETAGILPRAIAYLYSRMESAADKARFTLRASYFEIYNEQVYDLLNVSSNDSLSVRWNDRRGFYVQNLLVVQCDSKDDIIAVVREGHKNRRVGSHLMNSDSSRSHSIMTLYIDRHEKNEGMSDKEIVKYGKISFVDLAGSERLKETRSSNTEETCSINKSLLTLGTVISAASANGNIPHVPYRDSNLTKLLMDTFSGNSFTLMIACISPSFQHLEETLSTLHYATRARNIQNKPTVQVDSSQLFLSALRRENQILRLRNHELETALGNATVNANTLNDVPHTLVSPKCVCNKSNGMEELQRVHKLLFDQHQRVLLQNKHLQQQIEASKSNQSILHQEDTVDYLKRQVRSLQDREKELMQALSRRRMRL